MMWALYKKELRYRAGALLALPALAALVWYYTWKTVTSLAFGNVDNYGGLLDNGLAGWITLICASGGFAFGLWQVLRETAPGPWAFLRHRPATVWQLFLAKFLAALTLYVVTFGLPLAGLIAWMATPNRLPIPWLWPMAVPALQDFLGGMVYILAGMLCVSRPARWFGSRLFPAGGAVLGTLLTMQAPAWVGFLALGLAGLILLAAGSSALARRGREQSQPRFPRLLTAVAMWPTAIFILASLAALIVTLGSSSRGAVSNTYYELRNSRLVLTGYSHGNQQCNLVVDDDGHVLKDYPPFDSTEREATTYGGGVIIKSDSNMSSRYPRRNFGYYARIIYSNTYFNGQSSSSNNHWYYLPAQGCLVGFHYDPSTNQTTRLGYFGADGWNEKQDKVTPFHPAPGGFIFNSTMVVENNRVFWIDLVKRQVEVVYTAPPGETCLSGNAIYYYDDRGRASRGLWVVATDSAILVIHDNHDVVFRQAHPDGKYFNCSVGSDGTQSHFGLLYTGKEWRDRKTQPLYLRVDAEGKELTRTLVPLPPPYVSSTPKWASQAYATITPSWFLVLAWCFDPRKPTVPEMLACVLGTIIGILITVWLLRRYQVRRKGMALWVGVNLLLGLSAVLLMLAVRHWPVRVACPHCGKRRAVNQPLCPACGKDFPAPNPGEVGVFDHAVAG